VEVFTIRCEGDIEECIRRVQSGEMLQPRIFSQAMAQVYENAVRHELESEARTQIEDDSFISDFFKNQPRDKDDDEVEPTED